MTAKHTPGPWGWTCDGSSDYSVGPSANPQEFAVVGVFAYGRDDEKATANCQLIAAAPELLEALRDLREAVTDVYKSGRIAAEPFVHAGNIIAKAEGRA